MRRRLRFALMALAASVMSSMIAEPAIPTLPYADAPARWGISSQLRPGGFRIVVPPIRSWRHLHKVYLGILFPATMAVIQLAAWIANPQEPAAFLPSIVVYGIITLVLLAEALWRVRQRLVIDVTAKHVAIALVSPSGRGRRAVWERHEVVTVKRNPSNGKLLLRIIGKDLAEYWIGPNADVTEWVANRVQDAVMHGDFVETADGFGDPLFDGGWQWLARVLFWLGGAAVAVGLLLLVSGHSNAAALVIFLSLLFLAIVGGMVLGTQEKEFYV